MLSSSLVSYSFMTCAILLFGSQQQYSTTHAQILDEYGRCQLLVLLPFTDERGGPPNEIADQGVNYYGYGAWPDQYNLEKASVSLMATVEMAISHFNHRNPILVPQLSELHEESCTITFPESIYKNSGYTRSMAVDAVENVTHTAVMEGANFKESICAIIGPADSKSVEVVSAMTENLQIPHILYNSIDEQFSKKEEYPTLVRLIPSSREYGYAIANYFQRDVLHRDYVAIIYVSSDYGEMYEHPFEDAGGYLDYATIAEGFNEANLERVYNSLDVVVEQGFHTIMLVTDRIAMLDDVAKIAEEKGLLGEEYLWILSGDLLSPTILSELEYPMNSPTDKLLRGAAVYTNYDPYMYDGEKDPFLREWRSQNDTLMEQVRKSHPLGDEALYSGEFNYFQKNTPALYSSFLYDAIVSTGISACKAAGAKKEAEKDKELSSLSISEGTNEEKKSISHVQQLFESNFKGASGHVQFAKEKNYTGQGEALNGRDIRGVKLGMYNVRPGNVDSDSMRNYKVVLTHVYTNATPASDSRIPVTGSWRRVTDEAGEETEFLYFDGTPNEPLILKTIENSHYISKSVQVFGLLVAILGLSISIGTCIWVYVMRKSNLVKASQPEFLYIICFGSAMISLSLIFLSFDEDKGVSEDTLSKLCSAFPWLFVLGYKIMYCALYFKLWRLNKLLSMRRQAVHINQVVLPFAVIITLSIIVLICWQIINPLVWERQVISGEDNPADPLITYGECNSVNGSVIPYIWSLGIIIGVTVIMTGTISWKLKDVQSELSESKWIFFGIFSHMQIWALGIPLFIILHETSRNASYIIKVALVFILSSSMVILVIWPKIYTWIRDKWFGGPATSKVSISVLASTSRTHVSGLDLDGGMHNSFTHLSIGPGDSFRASSFKQQQRVTNDGKESKKKIASLEKEIEKLKRDYEQEKEELLRFKYVRTNEGIDAEQSTNEAFKDEQGEAN